MNDNFIRREEKSWFIMLPNLIDDFNLSPYAFRLYVHMKRVTGEGGECYQSTETLAKLCNISKGSVVNAKKELVETGLIEIEDCDGPNGPYHNITLVDLWAENAAKYGKRSPDDQERSPDERKRSPHEHKRSPHEPKNTTIKNNSLRRVTDTGATAPEPPEEKKKTKKPKEPKEDPPLYTIAQALAEVTGMDFTMNKARLFAEAKRYYKVEQVPTIKAAYSQGGEWYESDWRGKKGQPPTLSQIRETWATVAANAKPAVDPMEQIALNRAAARKMIQEARARKAAQNANYSGAA